MLKSSLLLVTALALSAAPTALAAAPTVRTGGVERATASTATLTGSVNPGGHRTQYRFEYGTTRNYGKTTTTKALAAGTKSVAVVGTATGLKANTVYHYRLIATNTAARRAGGDRFFRTPQIPVGVSLTRVTDDPVRFGEPVVLAGGVSGVPAGTAVALQQRPAPFASPFAALAQGATDAAGTFGFTVSPALNTLYRALSVAGNVPAASGEVLVRVRPIVGFVAARRVSRRGARTSMRGTVTPAHDGQSVRIQKRNSRGGFSTVAQATLTASSASSSGTPRSSYRASVRVIRSADYRVRLSAHADHANATSRERRVRVGGG